jgi:hypothetical protein
MIRFAAQPAQEGALQQLGVESVCLGPSVLAGNRDTIWVDDVGLNVASPQPTRQPKAVAAGLEGEHYAGDLAPGIDCLVTPAMQ